MDNIEEKTLSDLKVNELKIELETKGLDKTGVKAVLVERLEQALKDEGCDLNTLRFAVNELDSNAGNKIVICSSESAPHPSIKIEDELNDAQSGESISASTKISSESIVAMDAEIIKVDALSNQEVSKLNIDETQLDKVNSAELNVFPNKNVTNISEEEKHDEEIGNGSGKSLTRMNIKEGENEEAQATITNEIIRDNVIEQDDVMIEEKQEPKALTTPHIVKEPQSTTAIPSIQQNSQNVPTAVAAINSSATITSRDLTASIWIRNITNTTKAVELKALFSKHGKVVTAKIFTTKNKLSPTCFGFVVLSDPSSADLCVQKLNRMNFKGRIINVEKADRSNLSQINKSANGVANSSNSAASIQNNPPENTSSKSNFDSTSGKAKQNSTLKSKAHESEKVSGGETKRSPRSRVISTSNASSNEAHNSSKWRGSGLSDERRGYDGSRSFGSRSRMNAPYGNSRIIGIRHGRAGRVSSSRGRTVRNSSALGISDNFPGRSHFGSNNRRSTGRRREEESRNQRHKTNDARDKSRRSPADGKNSSTDKEELLRFMRRKEIEHRKKEEELRLERERENLRYEREKLEREKLELETYRLQAQLAQATQLQFAAVTGLPQSGAAASNPIGGSGDSSASVLHFGDSGFNHRREREDNILAFSSSERHGADMSAKNEISRSKSGSSRRNDRDGRSNRSRHSSRNGRGRAETSRRNISRSRSPLRRSGMSRHNSVAEHTFPRSQDGNTERDRPTTIYSNSRNNPMQLSRNNPSHSKRNGRSFEFDNYDNKRYFYNTGIDSTSKDGFAADGDRQMHVRLSNVSDGPSARSNERRDYYTGSNQYNTSVTNYANGGPLRSDPTYASRIQQQSQNTGHQQALSASRPADQTFGNAVFTQPSLGGGNSLATGYDSQHSSQQYNSGSNAYYQQGSVADWSGQLGIGGTSSGRTAPRSFLGVNESEGNVGSSKPWNSGGDWGGGANARTGTANRYNTSYTKPASGYSSGRRY